MTLFTSVLLMQQEPAHSIYVLSADGNTPGIPGTYFAYVANGSVDYTLPEGGQTLDQLVNNIDEFSASGHFVFFFTADMLDPVPTDPTVYEQMLQSLATLCLDQTDTAVNRGFITWPTNITAIGSESDACIAVWRNPKILVAWRVKNDAQNRLLSGSDRSLKLAIYSGTVPLEFNLDQDIEFSSTRLSLVLSGNNGDIQVIDQLTLAITQPSEPNCINVQSLGTATPNFFILPIGFSYALLPSESIATTADLEPSRLFYPLWMPKQSSLRCDQVSFNFSPHTIQGQLVHFTDLTFDSAYRDNFGRTITLSSLGSSIQYELCPTITGGFCFTPNTTLTPSYAGYTQNWIQLTCGLSANEVLSIPPNAQLEFVFGFNAVITLTAQAAGGAPIYSAYQGSEDLPYQTSWVTFRTDKSNFQYHTLPQNAPLFEVKTNATVFSLIDFGWLQLDTNLVTPVPLVPYGAVTAMPDGIGATAEAFTNFDACYITLMRSTVMLRQPGIKFRSATAITSHGIVVSSPNSNTISVSIAATDNSPTIKLQGDSKSNWAMPLFQAVVNPQAFLVVTTQPELTAGMSTPVEANIAIDGWAFDCTVPLTTPADFSGPIIILKGSNGTLSQMAGAPATWSSPSAFNNNTFDPTHSMLSDYIVAKINDARTLYANGDGVVAYGELVAIADDPNWNGFIIFNAPVDFNGCSDDVKSMLVGLDPQAGNLCASYIALSTAQVTSSGTSASAQCSFSGLIDYLRPGASLVDAQSGNPGYISSTAKYDFRLTFLRAQFKNARLIHFESAAILILGSLFDEDVIPYTLDGGQAAGSNTILILGTSQVGPNGKIQYSFSTPPNAYGTYFLGSKAVNSVSISQLSTLQHSSGNQHSITFNFAGWLSMRTNTATDLLSYNSIQYRGLSVTLSYSLVAFPCIMNFTTGGLPILSAAGEAMQGADDTPDQSRLNIYRPDSFVAKMPAQFVQLSSGTQGKKIAELGYIPIAIAGKATPPDPGPNWRGLLLNLRLGNNGATANNGLLNANILLTWTPGTEKNKAVSILPYFALSGPDGQALQLEIEGVIKLGTKTVALDKVASADGKSQQFVIQLQGLGLTVLSTTVPASGGLTVCLGGYSDAQGNRALGWFGGLGEYAEIPSV